jgi:hypothetical protein
VKGKKKMAIGGRDKTNGAGAFANSGAGKADREEHQRIFGEDWAGLR